MSRNSEDKNVCHRVLLNQHLYRKTDIVSGKACGAYGGRERCAQGFGGGA